MCRAAPRAPHPHPSAHPHSSVIAIPASPIVIDTNVSLDLWLFARDEQLREGRSAARLIGTLEMRDELCSVLHHSAAGRGPIAAGRMPPHAPAVVLASWDRHVRVVEAPSHPKPLWPRCRDASDQKFVDLALAESAGWLLTRDRALLKLARRCRAYGLVIAAPEAATLGSAPFASI